MSRPSPSQEKREGEIAVRPPAHFDASLHFIGRIRTPWQTREDCPRQGGQDGPDCRIEVFEPWVAALLGLDRFAHVDVLYWLDQSRRDLVRQSPRGHDGPRGTFALRSPVRPNPIGLSRVRLLGLDGAILTVRGLDCVDETPLLDLKPEHCHHSRKNA